MNKQLRIVLGFIGVFIGTVLFILPGSIFFLLAGLVLLSIDFPLAKKWLRRSQRHMTKGANRLDRYLLARKYR
ncbi:MAG: PGPGW domain-containing protein [Aestuariibacter sp.]